MRRGILLDENVDIRAEAVGIDARRPGQDLHRNIGRHELTLPQRCQLTDRYAVTGNDKALATIERAHDLSALVA